MARLLFSDNTPPPPSDDKPLTVTQVSGMIRQALSATFPQRVRIVGEISNFSSRAHWFFSLKDEGGNLSCVCFATAARKVGFPVSDGMEVIATGRLDYFESQGRLQLYVDKLEPVGQGALELRFRELCEQLRQLGYFEAGRKKPLPLMAERIAVITSRSAAALQDVIKTAESRWPGCRLYLMDVRVQGDRAAPEIAAAIDALSADGARLGIDAIILTRGGGSIEDLWAFNERILADAVYRCTLPIVAAIGHETDTTVAELVADERCSTPTQAAMRLVPDRQAIADQVRQMGKRLGLLLMRNWQQANHRLDAVTRHPIFRQPERLVDRPMEQVDRMAQQLASALPRRLEKETARFDALARHPVFRRPEQLLQPAERQVEQLEQRLTLAMRRRETATSDRLDALHRQLEAVSPTRVLQRGYSYTVAPNGHVLRRGSDAKPGDRLKTVLAEGAVHSIVEGADGPKRKRGGSAGKAEVPGLFDTAE